MTFIEEVVFSGFVSKAVNNIVDFSWTKMKKAVKEQNKKHQNLESQIYNVIIDVLNEITDNLYEDNQDKIYDATEVLLKAFKENEDELGYVYIRACLQVLHLNVDENKCIKFKVLLYEKLSKNDYSELFRAILLLQLENKNKYDHTVYEELNIKLDEVIFILNHKKYDIESNNAKQKIKSRMQEYADKWNENMFLNNFNKRDKNAGVNVKLGEVYLDEHLPHYIWKDNKKERYDLKDLLSEYIYEKNKMLFILGQPGIGKSTLITWIIANFDGKRDDILVYKFAPDLNMIDWKNLNNNIVDEILKALNITYNELYGKILILDGFDEIDIGNSGTEILKQLYLRLIKNSSWYKISVIITCRENYVHKIYKEECDYITLQSWDEIQIKSFCAIFQEKTNNDVSEYTIENVIKNKEILGIPLILYMVLALNISIENDASIVDIYDKIFSLEGGIYDRCIDYKSFANKHRIGEIKEQIHQISREIGIWMFENNPGEACIPQKEYQKVCCCVAKKQKLKNIDVEQDFKIGNYFKLVRHCEGIETEELSFVHRSIYEYFVAETIYTSIENAIIKLSEESQEEFAGKISIFLKQGKITYTICEYLQYKIMKLYNKMDYDNKKDFYLWWETAVGKMVVNGMFYYSGKNIQYLKNIIDKEIRCFLNLVKILRLIFKISTKEYMLEKVDRVQLEKYIRYGLVLCRRENEFLVENLNLKKVSLVNINLSSENLRVTDLEGADLRGADLRGANLSGKNFEGMNLQGIILENANLENANLQNADLKRSILTGIDLRGANLKNTIFDESHVYYLRDKYSLDNSKVYVFDEKKVISYKSYCERIKDGR